MDSNTDKKKGFQRSGGANQEKNLILWMLVICVVVTLLAATAVFALDQKERDEEKAVVNTQQACQILESGSLPAASEIEAGF